MCIFSILYFVYFIDGLSNYRNHVNINPNIIKLFLRKINALIKNIEMKTSLWFVSVLFKTLGIKQNMPFSHKTVDSGV